MEEIDVGLIFSSSRARPLDKANVARLAGSMREVGLVNAISVRSVVRHRGTMPFDAFEIVAGHHRYAAALELKWRKVRCEVITLDDLKSELAEIDENLIRSNLTPAQEAQAVARRKAIYEALHPETAQYVAGAHASNRAQGKDASDKMSFASATAEVTGKDRRTVERAAARGKALGADLKVIAGTALDKGAELDALARMKPAERAPLIERARAGERVSARVEVPPAKDADEIEAEQKRSLMNAWNKASESVRQWFRDEIADAPAMDRRFGS